MATLSELRARILRLLDDPEGAGYSDDLLLNAISAALDAILPWAPKTSISSITGDGTTKAFPLPTDLYEIEALVDESTGEVLPRSVLAPGLLLGVNSRNNNDWLEYPSGSISFSKAPSNGATYTLYYLAYHSKPTEMSNDFTLSTPDFCIIGLALYAEAYALLPAAVGVAEIGSFKTRVDSGTPEHNPFQRAVTFIMEAFTREMNRHPKHQRAVK